MSDDGPPQEKREDIDGDASARSTDHAAVDRVTPGDKHELFVTQSSVVKDDMDNTVLFSYDKQGMKHLSIPKSKEVNIIGAQLVLLNPIVSSEMPPSTEGPGARKKKNQDYSYIPTNIQNQFCKFKSECLRYARNDHIETIRGSNANSLLEKKCIVCIIGRPGDGKTSICKWLVSCLILQTDYDVIILKSHKDWRKYVNPCRQQILIIDDIFGSFALNPAKRDGWLDLVDEIKLALAEGSMRILITSRKQIYKEACVPQDKDIFLNIIDLTDAKNMLSAREKKDLLGHHMNLRCRSLPCLDKETFSFLDEDILGFPQCCHLYSSNDFLFDLGFSFFKNPTFYFHDLIHSMSRNNRHNYCALVLCMMHGGCLPKSAMRVTSCSRRTEVVRACGLGSDTSVSRIEEAADILSGSFFLHDAKTRSHSFQHHTIMDAVTRHFCLKYTDVVLQYGDLHFIAHSAYINNTLDNGDNPIKIISEDYGQLCERFSNEQETKSLTKMILESNITKSEDFSSCFVDWLHANKKLITLLVNNDYTLLKSNIYEGSRAICYYNKTFIKAMFQHHIGDYFIKYFTERNNDDIEKRNFSSYMLLWSTVANEVTFATKLLEQGCDPNVKSTSGNITPIHISAQEGHVALTNLLLHHGAIQNPSDKSEMTPLHRASIAGYTDGVESLLSHNADVNVVDCLRLTPLHLSAQKGHAEICKLLLAKQAQVNLQCKIGETPLFLSAKYGHIDVVHLLIKFAGDITMSSDSNDTPLHKAAQYGHMNIVSLLLDKGADVDSRNIWRATPVHYAAHGSHLGLIKFLHSKGADLNARNLFNQTPFHYIAVKNDPEKQELIDYLKSHMIETDTDEGNVVSLLHWSAFDGVTVSTEHVLQYGADPNKRGGEYSIGDVTMICNADLSVEGNKGTTALHMAAGQGHLDIVKIILRYHADKTLRDKNGKLAYDLACEAGHEEICKYIENAK